MFFFADQKVARCCYIHGRKFDIGGTDTVGRNERMAKLRVKII